MCVFMLVAEWHVACFYIACICAVHEDITRPSKVCHNIDFLLINTDECENGSKQRARKKDTRVILASILWEQSRIFQGSTSECLARYLANSNIFGFFSCNPCSKRVLSNQSNQTAVFPLWITNILLSGGHLLWSFAYIQRANYNHRAKKTNKIQFNSQKQLPQAALWCKVNTLQ